MSKKLLGDLAEELDFEPLPDQNALEVRMKNSKPRTIGFMIIRGPDDFDLLDPQRVPITNADEQEAAWTRVYSYFNPAEFAAALAQLQRCGFSFAWFYALYHLRIKLALAMRELGREVRLDTVPEDVAVQALRAVITDRGISV